MKVMLVINTCIIVALYTVTKDGTDNDYINGVLSMFFLYPQKQLSADATT